MFSYITRVGMHNCEVYTIYYIHHWRR